MIDINDAEARIVSQHQHQMEADEDGSPQMMMQDDAEAADHLANGQVRYDEAGGDFQQED